MGIVNVTPDSFSDGGQHAALDAAVAHGLELVQQGAAILDIGGESTRPGAEPVPLEEELRRVVPVVRELAKSCSVPLSVDTSKAEVARQSLEAGAHIINDVTALTGDPAMAEVVRSYQAGVIIMHMQGTPQTMQINPVYDDVVREVVNFLEARLNSLADLGIAGRYVAVDPGIGFGKTVQHNVRLMARLDALAKLARPVCLGVSRKGFLTKVTGRKVVPPLAASLATVCFALAHQSAHIFRVHDVAQTCDAVAVFQALEAEHV